MITAGEGRYKIVLTSQAIGNDLLVIITGGEEEHIGSVTLKQEKESFQTISKKGHKDYMVSERMTGIIYDKIRKDVLVICGIHIEDATKEEIDILVNNAQKCVDIFLGGIDD
ncbi:MAG: gallate decarboxylase subunit [Campylobacterota bacterium]|nr:gallate decarboxylase subunit [Campylobacterota bacterium]